jgi:uncharacterized protein YeaO (DUF488 family)
MAEIIRLKRVYEAPSSEDGPRILVERLWPRGLTKEKAVVDHWLKEIAPSPDLRKWYGHDVEKWEAFRERYRAELDQNPEGIGALQELVKLGKITFVYAARDEQHNSALVLKEYLMQR